MSNKINIVVKYIMRRRRSVTQRRKKQRRQSRRRIRGGSEKKDIVLIHSKGCHFCEEFMPNWTNLKKSLHGGDTNMVEIEASEMNTKLPEYQNKLKGGKEIKVEGYPTIVKIKGGNISYYEEERTDEKLTAWIKG